MFRKPVTAALVLITAGIVLGALIMSNFSGGVDLGFADSGRGLKLGGPPPITKAQLELGNLSGNFIEVAKAVTPSVVFIRVTSKDGDRSMPRDFFHFFGPDFKVPEAPRSQGAGSGVIITPDGYIATNNHVIENAEKDGIEVTLFDKSSHKAKLVGTDPLTDLAVVKIDAEDLPVAALGNSDNVQVGEWVLAIGNPLGLTSTVTAGIISAVGRGNLRVIRDADGYAIEDFIQTDAAINPGNSGGALVNMKGEVIGINTAIATTNARYQGYGFAVPVNLLKTVSRDLITEGEVRRGYIGVRISSVDQTMASALGLRKAQGVLVQGVLDDGAGAAAGLREGDVILSINDKEVNAANELQSYVATQHPGDNVTLKIFRDGRTIEKVVTLKARDEESRAVTAVDRGRGDAEDKTGESKLLKLENLGMSVRPLSAEDKRSLEVDKGVVVSDVKQFGEAFNRNIRSKDVILEADRQEVSSPSDLKKIIEARKPGDSILLRMKSPDRGTYFAAIQIPQE